MDEIFEKLESKLLSDPKWNLVTEQMSRTPLTSGLNNAYRATEFFAYHYDSEHEYQSQISIEMWNRLVNSIDSIFRIMERSGMTEIISKTGIPFLKNFSFVESIDFRNFEEKLVSNLKIPEKAWDEFWIMADRHKDVEISRFTNQKMPPSIVLWNTQEQLQLGPGKVKPLSPFKWGRAVSTGLCGVMLYANTSLAPFTASFSFASVLAPIVVLAVLAGRN